MLEETPTLNDLAERINAEHEQCGLAARSSLGHAMAAGALLIEAKALVPHGQWLSWLEKNCTVGERQAQVYMQITRDAPTQLNDSNPYSNTDLTITDVRGLLAEPRATRPQEPTLWDRVAGGVPSPVIEEEDETAERDVSEEDLAALWEANEPDGTGGQWPGLPPPRPMTPAIADERDAEADLAERWKKDDDVHRMLWHVSRITALDAREAARLLGGIASLNSFARNDLTAAEMGIDWLRDYARALREALGLPATGLRSVQ